MVPENGVKHKTKCATTPFQLQLIWHFARNTLCLGCDFKLVYALYHSISENIATAK